MTPLPHFLEAEYTPAGSVPITIGVIVWTPQGVMARFRGESANRPGQLPAEEIPGEVASHAAYRQWIHYWRRLIERSVERGTACEWETFRKELDSHGRGNFRLFEAGSVAGAVTTNDLPTLVDRLFTEGTKQKTAPSPRPSRRKRVASSPRKATTSAV